VELATVEQRAVALVVDRTIGRHVGHDSLGFTGLGLLRHWSSLHRR
jgi:hypothetical protein